MTSIPQLNTSDGLDSVIREVSSQVQIFTPSLLIFIFVLIFITGYRKQKEQSGNGDIAQWAVISSIVTSIVALILSIGVGMINITTLVTTIAITIVCGIWFLASGDRGT